MKVECIENRGKKLPKEYLKRGYCSKDTSFDLIIGKRYEVYGMCLSNNLLEYLIISESHYPKWYPAELSNVVDNTIPPNWKFILRSYLPETEVRAIWGYEELVEEEGGHFDALADVESEAITVFAMARLETEKLSQLLKDLQEGN